MELILLLLVIPLPSVGGVWRVVLRKGGLESKMANKRETERKHIGKGKQLCTHAPTRRRAKPD